MKRWISSVVFVLGMGVAVAFARGMGLEVSPSHFRIEGAAGETASGTVLVKNESTYAIRLRLEVADIIQRHDEEGRLVRDEAPPGTTAYSCAKWIQVPQGDGAIIQPGGTLEVPFVVSPPRTVQTGGYAAFLFFVGEPAEPPPASDEPGVQLVTIPRLGVSVKYEIAGTVKRTGELVAFDADPPTTQQPLRLRYTFKNTGNTDIDFNGTFHILDEEGLLIGKGETPTVKTFPGDEGKGDAEWKEFLPPGRYTLVVTFDLGPNPTEVIVRELDFEVGAR